MDDATLEQRLDRLEALAEGILRQLAGSQKRNEWVQWWESDREKRVREFDRKWTRETRLHTVGVTHKERDALEKALCDDEGLALVTLEDLAALPRDLIAGIRGVGPKTITRIEAGFDSHGLSWAAAELPVPVVV